MPAQDTKVSELAKLKNKLIELENQLKEEKKMTIKLRDKSESKIQQIIMTDTLISEELQSFKWRKEKHLYNQKYLLDQSLGKLLDFNKRENSIRQEIAEFDLLLYDNELLHNTIKDLSNEQLQTSLKFDKDIEKKAQHNFDSRIAMEELQRKVIKSFNENYKRDANAKMELEAARAKSENDRIHREFHLREAKTNALIKQQQCSYEQLMRCKIERDVLRVSMNYQDRHIREMSYDNTLSYKEVMVLEEIYRKNSNELDSLQASIDEINGVMDKMGQLKTEFVLLRARSRDLTQSCIEICQKIVSEGLEITHNAREYQSAQMTSSMDQMKLRDDASSRSSRRSTQRSSSAAAAGLQGSPNSSKSGSSASRNGVKPVDDSDDRSIHSGSSGLTGQSDLNAMKAVLAQNSFGRKNAQTNIEFSSSDPNLVWSSCDLAGNMSLNKSASGFMLGNRSKLNADVQRHILLQKKFHDMSHGAMTETIRSSQQGSRQGGLSAGRQTASMNDITTAATTAAPNITTMGQHRMDATARTMWTSFSMQNMH